MTSKILSIVTLVFVSLLFSSSLQAQEVTSTTRASGMGDALTAGVVGTSALWHNPAGIIGAMMYSAEAGYAHDSRTGINNVSANIVDTKTNPSLGAGLAFAYETANPEDGPKHEAYHIKGGFATTLVDGMVLVGGAVKYSNIELDGEESLAALILDAGILIRPLESLSIGVAGSNLVNGGYDEELPPSLAAGLAFTSLGYGFHLSGDVVFDLSAAQPEESRLWRAGAEFLISEVFPIRGGYIYDEVLGERLVTVGAGFRDVKSLVGFDASYQHNLDDSEDRLLSGSLSVYF